MISQRPPAMVALALAVACASPAAAQERAESVYANTLRGTALILTPTGSGTGWVVDLDQKLLITNEHVVTSHAQVEVVFPMTGKDGKPVAEPARYRKDAQRFVADVIDADATQDLSILRLREKPPAGTVALKMAAEEPGPAEKLHSIGNPDAS